MHLYRRSHYIAFSIQITRKGLFVLRRRFFVVDSLLIVAPIVGFCVCSMVYCILLCVLSSSAIILMGKRELVALYFVCFLGIL